MPAAMIDHPAGLARKRVTGGILAAALQAALVLVLIYGLAAPTTRVAVPDALPSLDLRLSPPPLRQPPPKPKAHVAKPRRAAVPASRAAAPVVATPVILRIPTPIPNALLPGAGKALIAGSGQGSGGSGEGAGGAGGSANDPELVGGRIKPSDTPAAMREAPFAGTTRALVLIDAMGQVTNCRTQDSSGSAMLDTLTCRLIQQRFRFRPARNIAGRPVAGQIIYEHQWEVGGGFDSDGPRVSD